MDAVDPRGNAIAIVNAGRNLVTLVCLPCETRSIAQPCATVVGENCHRAHVETRSSLRSCAHIWSIGRQAASPNISDYKHIWLGVLYLYAYTCLRESRVDKRGWGRDAVHALAHIKTHGPVGNLRGALSVDQLTTRQNEGVADNNPNGTRLSSVLAQHSKFLVVRLQSDTKGGCATVATRTCYAHAAGSCFRVNIATTLSASKLNITSILSISWIAAADARPLGRDQLRNDRDDKNSRSGVEKSEIDRHPCRSTEDGAQPVAAKLQHKTCGRRYFGDCQSLGYGSERHHVNESIPGWQYGAGWLRQRRHRLWRALMYVYIEPRGRSLADAWQPHLDRDKGTRI
ncbi:hypothetical protein FISHEDRAFT_61277 [Fistulina hepatica ATCC 64428]|uniref:Uncharacterized protein n=1 Tax=Fistulina hepatica ATCC 64428 TaxID=1128425 RepID=A0A0D7A2L0_9AGAR|nr:hypothetical protein FISHEDRAFT_61277 [Fistulina hepatica ATCC 64428]